MRTPEYLSPSSLKTFEADREEFYLKYLASTRTPKLPQTQPMSVGSAFDAYVKSFLYYSIHGNYGEDDLYSRDALFEAQVEPHNRDWAKEAGQYVYEAYRQAGALADLMLEMRTAVGKPRFEFAIKGHVKTHIGDVPILGRPDIFFTNEDGARAIYDWKVNGFCGMRSTSPCPGYVRVRDTWSPTTSKIKASRNNGVPHPAATVEMFRGIKINTASYLDENSDEWALQLATYGWVLGEPLGSEQLIFGIDQIVNCGKFIGDKPLLRVANHRSRISRQFQMTLASRYAYCWDCITSGHYFRDVELARSQEMCNELELQAQMLGSGDKFAKFINSISR